MLTTLELKFQLAKLKLTMDQWKQNGIMMMIMVNMIFLICIIKKNHLLWHISLEMMVQSTLMVCEICFCFCILTHPKKITKNTITKTAGGLTCYGLSQVGKEV